MVTAVLTAAMVLAQIPSSLWPALLPAGEADAAPISAHAVQFGSANIGQPASTLRAAQVVQSYGKLPLSFEVNRGQVDSAVDFIARGAGYTIFLTPTEQVLALRTAGSIAVARGEDIVADQDGSAIVGHGGSVVRMRLVGANLAAEVLGLDELAGKVNYFIGNDPTNWRTNVSTYAKVRYGDVYAGVDLVYYGNQHQLEYDFVLAPGADPSVITLGIDGAERLAVDAAGDLVISLPGGEIRQRQPHVYQDVEGSRRQIHGEYVLGGEMVVGFHLGTYDTSRPLVIDPVLVYSTYLGGNSEDFGQGIAVDTAGSVYVTGYTDSTTFPTAPTTSPLQATSGGGRDAFVTKINAAGSARVYSTYLGGSSVDVGNAIAVDSAGNAYITGSTNSTNFPTASPLQAALAAPASGFSDAFVTKINATGSALVYSTYLGGSSADDGNAIAVDSAGNAYVAGRANSTNFPTLSPLQAASGGLDDAFVAKINVTGSALVYSTYLGGSGYDDARGIAVDSTGVYVTGRTTSLNFPTASPLQATFGGGQDAYVTKVNAAGSALVYSTYLGGSANDGGEGIAVDAAGSAYVTGSTSSTNFPTTLPLRATIGGAADAFVTKLDAAGSARVYSTYLGGSGGDNGSAITVDAFGSAYVTGATSSTNFPTTSPLQVTSGGAADAFVTKINAAGSALSYSTYVGGTGNDAGNGIAVDAVGSVYVTGYTDSTTTFPTAPAASPLQGASGGGRDAFVAKISDLPDLIVTAFSGPASVNSGETANYTWTIKNQGTATANAVTTSPPAPPFVWGDQVWLSTSPTSIAGAVGAGGRVAQGSLAPGASYSSTFSATIPSTVPPGTYYFILQTDNGSQIAESDETNNLSVAVPVTIGAGRIAYVYTTVTPADITERDAWAAFLSSRSYTVDALTVTQAETADFAPYRAILISDGSGSLSAWGTPAAVAKIVGSFKPVIGIGEGGYAYFGRKFNGATGTIGWPNAAHGGGTSVTVVSATEPAWTTPNAIGAATGATVALYSANSNLVEVYDPTANKGHRYIGRDAVDPNYHDVIGQSPTSCDILWGFSGSPSSMTASGKALFENLLAPCVPAVASGTAQHRETADGTAATTTTVLLGGAVVTLIAPNGTKQRKIAGADGTYSFTGLLGNTTYVVGYDGTVAPRHYITGVRFTTNALGNAAIPAPHAVFNRKNHTWVKPFDLPNNVPVPDQVWRRGQATWYRFAITPQQQVTIELKGCAFNCDLVVYKDLQQVRAKLLADAQTQTGIRLSAQGDIMADDLDADDLDADDLDADDLDADDLDADDLDADDLDADDLDADDLDAADLAAGYGETYVAVQRKGLRAASLTPGLAPETVVLNTRNLTGYLYVRVAGGSSLTGVFTVTARQTTDLSCVPAPLISRSPSTTFGAAVVAGKRSLILTDTLAYGLVPGPARDAFLAKLAAFAAHPTVQGQVVDLAGDAGYQLLRADWALARACVAQANLMTDAIREVVQRFRAADPSFEYLINAGGDAVIPYRRVADWAEISRESKYSPPLNALSASEASLVGDTFLSDDFYVSSAIESPNRTLYLPDIAVGRLVESVAEVGAYIDMYLLAGGVASPTSALSTGYDFNIDLANYVTAELAARGLAVDASLVSSTWTSAAWRDTVLNSPAANAFGILSLQGHFSANRLVPADNGQRVRATEIAAVTDGRFMRALVYSLGCHSGYSIVNADGSIFTQPVAFPEAFVGKGATLVGGTGYQYGETVLMKNSEALLALLTNELGYKAPPSGPDYLNGVPIGKALMYAKRAYMAQTATPRGIDLKVVNVSTVYGSPTMAFKLPNTHARPSAGTVAPSPVTGFAGLSALDLSPSFSLTRTPLVGDPAYYSAGGATTTAPYRPIAPLVTVPANAAGQVLQGAVFLGGPYTEAPFTPRLSIPATEQAGEAPRYANDVFMPVIPLRTNLFDGDAVQILPFQYRSNALGTSGTARVFGNVSVRGYWSNRTGVAAAADAPVVRDVSVKLEGGQLVVIATVRGLTDPGVAEVYVTYTNTAAVSKSFASLAMTEIPLTTVSDGVGLPGFTRLYRATLPGDPAVLRFLVQAVSGNGRVAVATSNGQLYGMPTAVPPAVDTRVASAMVLSAPATAIYRSTITASATLTADGQPLAGKSVRLELGGSSRLVTTNASGVASATLDVNVTPRSLPYALRASFAGDASAFGSGASTDVTVDRAPTVLQTLTASPQYSDSASVARLTAYGLTLNEQPVVIERGGVQVATFTDFAGEVRFDTIDFGAGAGASTLTITYPGNTRYAPAGATMTVTVLAETATLALTQDPQPTGPVTISATVLQQADGSLGDLTRASVVFTITSEAGALVSTTTVAASASGIASVTLTLPVGLYRVSAQVIGDFTSELTAVTLPVYDPAMFVSGGGWVPTGPTPTGVPANAKGHFAFIAKYLSDNVTPSGSLNVHVKSASGKDSDTDAQAQANGSLKFRATSFDYLLIAGNGAAFTGTGTVNGVAGYRYRADVVDGSPDVFVLHIWDPTLAAAAGGSYDYPKHVVRGNLGGGNIRIHR